ncbi:acyl carrier protein [Legionella israelensis]|uniref:Acyl carrier protein n=1 Tax=Legionella israelensis TaxID=454 RepID=A0A0W0WNV8_9GAMM|nr:acyl carrier protein [Legionella israelensis]KTD33979.1 Acyl carrier protein [Legionella israelensis]QBS10685.1 acyl carrier protein [Legionella israelensis]SCX83737.1 acyl carrier protein [Legionella israelensis DSM 19235]STX57641.1 Acyl carrier protein [Legionella israelensis]
MTISSEEILSLVKGLNTTVSIEEIDERSNFSDIGIDSLELFTLLLGIEEKYGIKIPEEKVAELNSIARIKQYLNGELCQTA